MINSTPVAKIIPSNAYFQSDTPMVCDGKARSDIFHRLISVAVEGRFGHNSVVTRDNVADVSADESC